MNINKKVKNLNSEKSLINLDKELNNLYNYEAYLYYTTMTELNKNFYSKDMDFYYTILTGLSSVSKDLIAFQDTMLNNIQHNLDSFKENYLNVNTLEKSLSEKLKNHLNKENLIFKKYLYRIQDFVSVLNSSTEFIQQHLIDNDLIFGSAYPLEFIVTYALPVRVLKEKLEENNVKYNSDLNFVFNSLKYLPDTKETFIILSKHQLKLLKQYNSNLNNIVNFPIWNECGNKFMSFNNGIGKDVFPEFTETY